MYLQNLHLFYHTESISPSHIYYHLLKVKNIVDILENGPTVKYQKGYQSLRLQRETTSSIQSQVDIVVAKDYDTDVSLKQIWQNITMKTKTAGVFYPKRTQTDAVFL